MHALAYMILWLRLQALTLTLTLKPKVYFHLAPMLYLFTHRRVPVRPGFYILADRRVPIAAIRKGMAVAHEEMARARPGTVLLYNRPAQRKQP